MTEVEKLMNSTHSGKANLGPEAEAKHKARQKAAREWVQKWAAVDDMITNAVADGFNPAELTEERIIDLLVLSWEEKADAKNDAMAEKMSARFAKPEDSAA